MADTKRTIAVIGGTGALGGGLARRWAKAGHKVIIGSREAGKAQEAADALKADVGGDVVGMENGAAAEAAEIVALTVPFSNQQPMLEVIKAGVQGKILIDATVPLVPPKVGRVQLPEEDSAAVRAQAFVGEGVKPDGQPWWIELELSDIAQAPGEPRHTDGALVGLAIATSGDFVRRREGVCLNRLVLTGRRVPAIHESFVAAPQHGLAQRGVDDHA